MAIVFAVGLGCFGVHRFTLGQWQLGLVHVFLMVVSLANFEGEFLGVSPWTTLSALLAYGTALWWWRMGNEEFAERYLELAEEGEAVEGKYLAGTTAVHPKVKSRRERRKMLASAKQRYESYDLQGAAELYEAALDLDLSDGDSRVLAARCYSLLEDQASAYRHLRRAVQLEAGNLDLVDVDEGFAWLRTRPDFVARRRAGYAHVAQESVARGTSEVPVPKLGAPVPNVLDRLEQLGSLRERGLLDEEEFAREKRRLLR